MAYPSYAAAASSLAQVEEVTFMLCKPDVQDAHRMIVQAVSEAGFHVQAKSFRITPDVALELAKMFPSVRRRRGSLRQHSAGRHGHDGITDENDNNAAVTVIQEVNGGAASTAESLAALVGGHDSTTLRDGGGQVHVSSSAPAEPWLGGAHSALGQLCGRRYEELSAQEWLNANVQHLLRSGTCLGFTLCAPNAVERLLEMAGPENPAVAQRVAPRSLRALFGTDLLRNAIHAAATLTEANAAIQAVFGYAPRYATIEARPITTGDANSSDAGPGAALDGESEGRHGIAPEARGVSLEDAAQADGLGRPPRHILQLPLGGPVTAGSPAGAGARLGFRRGVPEPVTLNALLSGASACSPVTRQLASTASLALTSPTLPPLPWRAGAGAGLVSPDRAHLAGRQAVGGDGLAQASSEGGGGAGALLASDPVAAPSAMGTSVGAEAHVWQAQQQREAVALYEKLARQQQRLRVREVELLLREQAFQERTGSSTAVLATPVPGTAARNAADAKQGDSADPHGSASGPRLRSNTCQGGGSQPPPVCGSSASSGILSPKHLYSRPGGSAHSRHVAKHGFPPSSTSAAAVVGHEDVVPLIHLSERRRALFSCLDWDKTGYVTTHAFMSLYDRSPSMQLCQPNDREVVAQMTARLAVTAQGRMDYDAFTMALLYLLKQ